MKSAAREIHDAYALFVTKDNALEMPYADLRAIASKTESIADLDFTGRITAHGTPSRRLGAGGQKALLKACEAAKTIAYVENLNPFARALSIFVHAPDSFRREEDHQLLLTYAWLHCATTVDSKIAGEAKSRAIDIALGRVQVAPDARFYQRALDDLMVAHATIERYKQIANNGRLHRPATIERYLNQNRQFQKKAELVYDALDELDAYVLTGLSRMLREDV